MSDTVEVPESMLRELRRLLAEVVEDDHDETTAKEGADLLRTLDEVLLRS